ncbi:nitroreductase family protein [Sunxiuqinia sp. A32]|uniref:nitroreductase family protein n=1 Tax=Sunxiuqinia sp. A32 TaxID=3461496 RepID=UPI004045BA55
MNSISENYIDHSLCLNCKLCIEICPTNIIGTTENDQTYFIEARESICLKCGQCMAICKSKAIHVDGFSYENDLFDLPANIIEYDQFMDFLATRRSIRNFKKKPVSNKLISQIIDSISFAPFGSDPQEINITVVNNREKIESALPHIERFLDQIVKWIENPISRFLMRKRNSVEKFNTVLHHLYPMAKLENYKLKYGDRITRGAPVIIIFHANRNTAEHTNNSLINATYAMLTAHSLGLGATMIEIVPASINKVDKVREIFQIPANHEAIMSVIVGHPKYKYQSGIKRSVQEKHWIN